MFDFNTSQIAILSLWVLGLVAAVALFREEEMPAGRIPLLVVAFAVPVLGSLLAIALWNLARRRTLRR